MSSGPADWHRFKRPGFLAEFSYPRLTPQGHSVERFEEHVQDHRGDMERVHLSSPKSGELYFEVARFRELAPQDDLSEPRKVSRAAVRSRFGQPAGRDDRPGKAGVGLLHRRSRPRTVVLMLHLGSDTYRFIYDPRSELNQRVLATLTIQG